MCLSARRSLCIHPKVSKLDERESVDSECRRRTAPWVAQTPNINYNKVEDIENAARCIYYDQFQDGHFEQFKFPTAIYNLDDLRELG